MPVSALSTPVVTLERLPDCHRTMGDSCLAGRRKLALEVLEKLETYAKERYVSPLKFAWIQFALGGFDLGFRWMQKAFEDRSFDLISIKVDPRFDALKDEPRFETIARRMGVVSAT
jgi:serine/threonine-protein kinase